MKQYTTAFTARVLQRVVGPRAISAYRVASKVRVLSCSGFRRHLS